MQETRYNVWVWENPLDVAVEEILEVVNKCDIFAKINLGINNI